MRFLKNALPHLSIALSVSVLVLVIMDSFNPMMGFLMGTPFQVITISASVCAIATGILAYAQTFRKRRRPPAPSREEE